MANLLLAISAVADVALTNNRIVKQGSGDFAVTTAVAATDALYGVVNEKPYGVAAGEQVDVVRVGIAWVEAGAAAARGAPVTADAVGRGVAAAPAAGSNVRIIGFFDEAPSAAGDVVRVMLSPGLMQG
ncbi:DUF2190 domain-containing protein [Rhodoferax sp.]|uniref:structural cement protein Gp24 n=1 Tax=Rhodoferax sp. TaxID=50421 RepID=UPI0028420970|nr:DUF2190 domain-containing protein [Rhodoferax sp.]MDR3370710.1 DUF2190 domain-containing protein [Rhodoferax sp.]